MERVISSDLRREVDKQESAEVLLCFVTITHPSIDKPLRVVCDPEDFVYGGETFTGYMFDFEIMDDSDRPPEARLKIQAISRKISDALQSIVDPARVKLEILKLSDFDTTVKPRTAIGSPAVEYVADKLYLVDIGGDDMEISGRLVSWDYSQSIWPVPLATERRFPGLYK